MASSAATQPAGQQPAAATAAVATPAAAAFAAEQRAAVPPAPAAAAAAAAAAAVRPPPPTPPPAPAVKQQAAPPPPPQQQPQQQPVPKASAVDLVIDEVLGGDLSMQDRDLLADEMAYGYFSSVREAAGEQLDPETSARLNQLAAITAAEKDAILQKTNRMARRVLRPLGYKMLQVQGLDPATVAPAAARAALEADLTPQQQAVVDAEAERLFKQVYVPELQAAAADLDLKDPDEAWEEFGRDILARQPEAAPQQSTAAIAVPAALAGAVVALVVSKVVAWIQRRRQQKYEDLTGSEYYEEEEILTGTDSARDDASAYAE